MIPDDPYGEIQMLVSELPDSAHTIVAKSREFREAEEVDFALTLLDKALAKDPAPIIREEYADLLRAEGRQEEALEAAKKAMSDDPNGRRGWRVYKRVLLGDFPDNARKLVKAALALDDEELTEDLLVEAASRAPEQLVVQEQLARVYATQRRVEDLIAVLQDILQIDPEHHEALLMLAGAFIKEGDLPRGQKYLNKARKVGADSPRIEELERKIGDVVNVINKAKKS